MTRPRLGRPERTDPAPVRRRGKEARERALAALLLIPAAPLMVFIGAAIKVEALVSPVARGPVFFVERRVSRGREIDLVKFRCLTASTLAGLGEGPTHVKQFEVEGSLTRVGQVVQRWYLDELPQLVNILAGDMFFIGTRPWPVASTMAEYASGEFRKFHMPAGLWGPVQSTKGSKVSGATLDAQYWEDFQGMGPWALLRRDLTIARACLRVQLEHRGL